VGLEVDSWVFCGFEMICFFFVGSCICVLFFDCPRNVLLPSITYVFLQKLIACEYSPTLVEMVSK
jgi:hypothetical protein